MKTDRTWLPLIATAVVALVFALQADAQQAPEKSKAAKAQSEKAKPGNEKGDLRSGGRRGQETRAEQPETRAEPRTEGPAERGEPSEYGTRPEVRPLTPARFISATLSVDGALIGGLTRDGRGGGELVLWDVPSRQLKFQQHMDRTGSSVALSPDNAWLGFGSYSGEVLVYDIARSRLVASWKPHANSVVGVAFSPDSKLLASASTDGSVKLWDVNPPPNAKEGLPMRLTFDAHTSAVLSAAFAPDGKTLYTGCLDQKVFVWDLQKGRKQDVWANLPASVQQLAVSPDGEAVAVALRNGTVEVRKRSDGSVLHTLPRTENGGIVTKLSFARQKPLLATAGNDGAVRIWDFPACTLWTTVEPQLARAWSAELTADGERLLTSGGQGTARMIDIAKKQELFELRVDAGIPETDSSLVASAWSRDRKVLATAHADGSIRLRDSQTGHTLKLIAAPVEILPALALSPDGRRLVGAGEDRALYLWDLSGKEIGAPAALRGHTGRVTSLVFTSDGKSVFSASIDGSVRQWNAADGSAGLVLETQNDKILCLACGDDGRWLAAGGHAQVIHLWNLASLAPKPMQTLYNHSGAVTALAFSAERLWLASAGDENSLFLWNLQNVNPQGGLPDRGFGVNFLAGHLQPVQCLAFSPRGNWLATGSNDGTVRLWSTDLASSIQVFSPAAIAQSLAFDGETSSLFGVGRDRTLGIWRARYGITFPPSEGRYLKLKALSEVNGQVWTTVGEIRLFSEEKLLPTGQWKLVSADSEEGDTPGTYAFDGNPRTFWGTKWRSGASRHPHEIVIDLGKSERLTGFSLLPRHDGSPNGTIKDYELYLGNDPKDFGPPISQGQLPDTAQAAP